MSTPQLYNTPSMLQNPAEQFAGASKPIPPPKSPSAALSAQKKMQQSGIQQTKIAYAQGIHAACTNLGLNKTSSAEAAREFLHRVLAGPYGEAAVRTAVQGGVSAGGGAIAGSIYSDQPGKGALLGALSGGLGGLAVAGAPKIQQRLIQALQGIK
jgi:hypothetical protein